MKKIIAVLLSLCFVVVAFVGCSSNNDNAQTTASSNQSTTQDSNSLNCYDRNGVLHNSFAELPFYDADGNEYYYVDEIENAYFVDNAGKHYDGMKCFVDRNSNFIYDSNGEIKLNDDGVSATAKDGSEVYPAATVRWDVDGNMATFFGFGELIIKK